MLSALTAFAAVGCGKGQIGDACGKESDLGQCVDEALCAKDTRGELFCLQRCVQQSDCPSAFNCNGTSGSIKVCQPK